MFAKITRDLKLTGEIKAHVDVIPPAQLAPGKPYWVPIVEQVTDISTGGDKVATPWVEVVQPDKVLRTRTIRDRTPQEIAAEDDALAARLLDDVGTFKAVGRVLFDHENRLRALEGRAPVNAAQFRAALKSLLR